MAPTHSACDGGISSVGKDMCRLGNSSQHACVCLHPSLCTHATWLVNGTVGGIASFNSIPASRWPSMLPTIAKHPSFIAPNECDFISHCLCRTTSPKTPSCFRPDWQSYSVGYIMLVRYTAREMRNHLHGFVKPLKSSASSVSLATVALPRRH